MTKLYVKLVPKSGAVFTQELPFGVMRGEAKDDNFIPSIEKTAKTIQARLDDTDDVLSFGDLTFEVVTEEEHLTIVAENDAKQKQAIADAEAAVSTPEQIERRDRVVTASKAMADLDYVTAAEGIVSHEAEITELKGGEGATVLSNLVELLRKQDAVIRSGQSYPNIQKAAVAAFDDAKPETAADGLAAALKNLGL